MGRIRVPVLVAALPVDIDPADIYEVFEAVLDVAPMSKSEIADEIGVNQSTVSRWAAGEARPSMEDMLRVLSLVEDRLGEIEQRVSRTRDVLAAVDEAMELRERYLETREPDDYRTLADAFERLRQMLGSER